MEAAVQDGVDVILLSIGGPTSTMYDHDVFVIGAFSAMEKGVVVVDCCGWFPSLQRLSDY